ncbi:hypothetical protein Taro_018523 [Colocasia esculenta]|uniref:Protein BZR1 homolog n=1 Tax=Colocasia esculenta TaxID=4460 RepID=A0A843UWH2_COLES|nr:hypothetical protein [Colocasia esculenta]
MLLTFAVTVAAVPSLVLPHTTGSLVPCWSVLLLRAPEDPWRRLALPRPSSSSPVEPPRPDLPDLRDFQVLLFSILASSGCSGVSDLWLPCWFQAPIGDSWNWICSSRRKGGEEERTEMTSGTRLPTWKERENNKRRERRRRAIAAKIYAGLRMYGNYKLPKHCDNNEVLKALCREAGWTVEEDGTTYRKGCRPVEHVELTGGSASPTPCSSYQPSPCASYNPSPASSSFPSPASSSYITYANNAGNSADVNSLIPFLKNLSSASSSASSSKAHHLHHLYLHGGSISAPVTPPLSSPTARSPRIKTDWDDSTAPPSWAGTPYGFLPSSTPPSPGRQIGPDAGWLAGLRIPTGGPSSPTFSLVSSHPFGFFKDEAMAGGGSSRMWTPGQSGTCSPAVPGGADVQMSDVVAEEFAFGSSSSNGNTAVTGLVKAWEGERIHEDASDELELTLGTSRTRSDA